MLVWQLLHIGGPVNLRIYQSNAYLIAISYKAVSYSFVSVCLLSADYSAEQRTIFKMCTSAFDSLARNEIYRFGRPLIFNMLNSSDVIINMEGTFIMLLLFRIQVPRQTNASASYMSSSAHVHRIPGSKSGLIVSTTGNKKAVLSQR